MQCSDSFPPLLSTNTASVSASPAQFFHLQTDPCRCITDFQAYRRRTQKVQCSLENVTAHAYTRSKVKAIAAHTIAESSDTTHTQCTAATNKVSASRPGGKRRTMQKVKNMQGANMHGNDRRNLSQVPEMSTNPETYIDCEDGSSLPGP